MTKKIFLWTITVLGLAILFGIFSLMIESRLALKWSRTKGQMISSLLFIKHLPKFIDFSSDPARWYGTDVQYEYSVGDRTYFSNGLSFAVWGTRSPKTALAQMNKYRRHHEVIVYYDPADPQKSLLEPGNIGELGDITMLLMIGGLLAFVGLFAFYEQSLEYKTAGVDNHLKWGNSYQKSGKYNEALREFNKIIEISPHLAQGYKSRGNLYFQLEYWDEAITDFNQAIMIDPTDAKIFFNRASAFLGKKQYDKAWEGMQKAMERGLKVKPEILEEIKKGIPPQPS